MQRGGVSGAGNNKLKHSIRREFRHMIWLVMSVPAPERESI